MAEVERAASQPTSKAPPHQADSEIASHWLREALVDEINFECATSLILGPQLVRDPKKEALAVSWPLPLRPLAAWPPLDLLLTNPFQRLLLVACPCIPTDQSLEDNRKRRLRKLSCYHLGDYVVHDLSLIR